MFEERRSIRKYLPTPVSKEKILQILEAGRVAPSAKNRQPWKYVVYTGTQKEALLDAMEQGLNRQQKNRFMPAKFKKGMASAFMTLKSMRQAPVIIMTLNPNSNDPFKPVWFGKRINEIHDTLSLGASIENMLLKATELGIGSLWIGNTVFAHKELSRFMGIDCQIAGAVALGYAVKMPEARPRKTMEEITEFHCDPEE